MALLPAIVSVLLIIFTKRVILSLFLGSVVGAFIVGGWQLGPSLSHLSHFILLTLQDRIKIEIAIFVIFIGGLLEIIYQSGAYYKYASAVANIVKTKRATRLMSWILGVFFSFDDAANCLITGSIMRPLYEKRKIPNIVLAYVVDTLASLASMMLVSTWAAFEIALIKEAAPKNFAKDFSVLFVEMTPFHFYTVLSVFLALLVVIYGRWLYKSNAYYYKNNQIDDVDKFFRIDKNVKVRHVVFPFIYIVGMSIGGMFISGWIIVKERNLPITLTNILGLAPTIDILLFAIVSAYIITLIYYKKTNIYNYKEMFKISFVGMKEMFFTAMTILLATLLAQSSKAAGAGEYAITILQKIPPHLLPALIFLISLFVAIAIGSSWSTMAILIVVGFEIAIKSNINLLLILASIISASVAGAQFVPYSDKCIISATASGVNVLEHVKTQIPHVITAIVATIIAQVIYLKFNSLILAYIVGMGFIVIIFSLFSKKY